MFVWLPIFNALTQNKLSNPTKSPHCLPVCEVMSITSRKKREKGREMKREEGWSEGEESETCIWVFFCFRGESYLDISHLEHIIWTCQHEEYVISHGYSVPQHLMHAKSQECRLFPVCFLCCLRHRWLQTFSAAWTAQYITQCHDTQSFYSLYNQKETIMNKADNLQQHQKFKTTTKKESEI